MGVALLWTSQPNRQLPVALVASTALVVACQPAFWAPDENDVNANCGCWTVALGTRVAQFPPGASPSRRAARSGRGVVDSHWPKSRGGSPEKG